MNTDYRINVGLFRHHKTIKLKKRLGSEGVLALLKIWSYAAEFFPDGNLSGMSAKDIELAIDWKKKEPLITNLVTIGFVNEKEGIYSLHEWNEHQPESSRRYRYKQSGGYDENGNRLFPEDWQDIKASVYKRDGRICQYCGSKTGPFHIDHVTPRIKGGQDVIENLVVSCASCNLSKGSKTVMEWQS